MVLMYHTSLPLRYLIHCKVLLLWITFSFFFTSSGHWVFQFLNLIGLSLSLIAVAFSTTFVSYPVVLYPQTNHIIWYLSSLWLILFDVITLNFIQVVNLDESCNFIFVTSAQYSIVCVRNSFFIYSFVIDHLDCFHILTIVISIAVNTGCICLCK